MLLTIIFTGISYTELKGEYAVECPNCHRTGSPSATDEEISHCRQHQQHTNKTDVITSAPTVLVRCYPHEFVNEYTDNLISIFLVSYGQAFCI